ncbi:MAG: RiPP maturation radical SAM C-methyltransferase [Desulfosudaceae bacterium]
MTHPPGNIRPTGGIALVSAPWPMFSRPSIQLGALKAYLRAQLPQVPVTAHHFFLEAAAAVGYPLYRLLARETWLAESVYAALLYPEQRESAARLFARQAGRFPELRSQDFDALVRRVDAASEAFIRRTEWRTLLLAGFSICLCQLTASLYLMRRIRAAAPDLVLVAGGAIGGEATAADLLHVFPEIDLIILGEGELPLTRLADHLSAGGSLRELSDFPGIMDRHRPQRKSDRPRAFSQLPDLGPLPMPDYTDYFAAMKDLPPGQRFFATLPVESSRGCWWRGRQPSGAHSFRGCAFCNLNNQWQGYRVKPAARVVAEVDRLTAAHRVLSVAFMDNALPPQKSRSLFQALADQGKDLQCFAELRATTSPETLASLRAAGMSEVQIGIEALSTRLLRKLNKGTTAMDNLAAMKYCQALGIKNLANLIIHFPGSDEEDVAETLRTLRYARFFQPLRIVHFWLGRHSPVAEHPRDFGLTAVFNHPFYRYLFPEQIVRQVRFPLLDYRGDKQVQRKLWQPVVRAVKQWQDTYPRLRSAAGDGPILTCRDGKDFLLLREQRLEEEPANHRLEAASRQIYLFCDRPRPVEEVCQHFSPLPADRVRAFLAMMADKDLMYEADGQVLSLAVPETHR